MPSTKRKVLKADEDSQPSKCRLKSIPFIPRDFNVKRCRLMTTNSEFPKDGDCVVYWMSRDQRVNDNHAIFYAQSIAIEKNIPLKVIFNLVPQFLQATLRQYDFMLKGLKEVECQLRSKFIPFYLLMGDPVVNIPLFIQQNRALALVTDFSPLRVGLNWVNTVAQILDNAFSNSSSSYLNQNLVPLIQVDAHNIVPCWEASPKLEVGARTIRPKIHEKLDEFCTPIPLLPDNTSTFEQCELVNWDNALASLQINRSVTPVTWLTPGTTAGYQMFDDFVQTKLSRYADDRNDPNENVASNLSPYLHFGQISIQRIVLNLKSIKNCHSLGKASFIEEAVVRRELSDNFCFYNADYDSLAGCSQWARDSLSLHSSDPRPVLYSEQELEEGRTYDDLWNAAQLQLQQEGKMHGFLRMYWAKKILEWSVSPAEALRIAVLLNDKYSLDGRDPNGYVGCMWSIAGVHDMGWTERPIFGKVRFMNYAGCKRKFDIKSFVSKYPPAAANAAAAVRPAEENGAKGNSQVSSSTSKKITTYFTTGKKNVK